MTRAMIAKIHIAKKEMGLDDASYRNVLKAATGKDSSKALSERELERVLGKFRELGWKPKRSGSKPSGRPHVRKIHALWSALEKAGKLRDASPAALRSFVQRQTGCDAAEFLTSREAGAVIEALKAWLNRRTADHDA